MTANPGDRPGQVRELTVSQLRAALQITEVAAVTAYFSVAARHNAAVLETAVNAGAAFCPWPPVSLIQPGVLTDAHGPHRMRSALQPIAGRHGATVPQAALAWLLARSPVILPIPATTSATHMRENIRAQDLELTHDELELISGLALEDRPA